MKRAHVYYTGDCHGVGFRFTAIDVARRHKVGGWVRNAPNRMVELIAEGEVKNLTEFFQELDTAMAYYIRDKKVSWEPATGEFSGFGINY